MTGFWLIVLFGTAATAVWWWRKHCRELEQKRSECLHRPTVVLDGEVDLCRFCGQVVQWR